jgi:hypothetical protein
MTEPLGAGAGQADDLESCLEAARAAVAAIAAALSEGKPIESDRIAELDRFEKARARAAADLGLAQGASLSEIREVQGRRDLLKRLADMPDAGLQEPIVAPLREHARAALARASEDEDVLVRIARLDAAARAGAVEPGEVQALAALPAFAGAVTLASLGVLPLLTVGSGNSAGAEVSGTTDLAPEGALETQPDGRNDELVAGESVSSGKAAIAAEPVPDSEDQAAAFGPNPDPAKDGSSDASSIEVDALSTEAAEDVVPAEDAQIDGVSEPAMVEAVPAKDAQVHDEFEPTAVEGVVPAEDVQAAPVEPELPQRVVEVVLPEAESSIDSGPDIDVTPLLASLIRDSRDGLAHHLAEVAGVPGALPLALRAVSHAAALRTGSGPAATASRIAMEDLATTALEFDQPSRLLAIAAAVHISCAAPHLGGTEIIDAHGMALAAFPQLMAFVDAIRSISEKGITIFEHVVGSTSDLVSLEARRRALAERASAYIAHPPQNRFPRAGDLLRDLVAASDSDVHAILTAVAEDDVSGVGTVDDAIARLSSRGALDGLVDAPRRRRHAGSRRRIVGDARISLLENLREVVDIGEQWAGVCHALARPGRDHEGAWLAEPIEQLRHAAVELRDAELPPAWPSGDDDPVVAAAAGRALDTIRAASDVVLGGEPSAGPDREPWRLLGRELLRDPDIRLSSELVPRAGASVERLAALVQPPDWRSAALARARRGDAELVELALAELPGDLSEEERAAIDRETGHLLEEARRRVELLQEDISGDIAAFFLKGAIDEDDWQALSRELEAMAATADDLAVGDRIDDLIALKSTVAEVAAAHTAANQPGLRADLDDVDLSDEARRQIDLALEAQDLATAERMVLDARRGLDPVAPPSGTRSFEQTFPAIAEALTSNNTRGEALASTLIRERTLFELPVRDRADDDYLSRAADGLRAVDRLRGSDSERRLAIREIMALIGLPTTEVKRGTTESGWLRNDVVARVADKAVVPQFGSDAGGRYRVLVMRADDATEDRITSWLAEHGSERATIVLYDGVLSPMVRRRLADRARKAAPTNQALVIDLALLASVAALDYGSFETTVHLALPFTGINPYNPYASGLVPLEMFYGRRDVREDLLSATGQIAFIYGGRRLGKSALLRAVHRDARGQEGIRVCYIDLQDKGVGEHAEPSKVFELVEAEFADLLPVSRRHGGEARLSDRVKQLAQDPEAPRLLVLLDEADRLIDADSEEEFRTLGALRRLRDETQGRIRFVFAGLHSVRRFHDLVNQRLVQFGRSQSIGALEPPAAQHLVQRPLEALGYRLDLASVNRILTLTQHQPSLIQVVCDELLKFLHGRSRRPDSPPYIVSRQDVDRVLAQQSLTREIVDRFELTVRLDDRYRVIALVVAYLAAEDRMNAAFEVEELWDQCQSWWPAGFSEQSRDTVFDALLEEMVGLGVLYMRDNRYGLYSPHVGRMLGTQLQIAGRLREAGRKPAPARGFDGSTLRLPLSTRRRGGHGARELKGSRVSPLNLRQVTALQQPANDVHLIVGSRALGSGDLGDVMRELVGKAEGLEVLLGHGTLAEDEEAKRFVGRLKTTARGLDRVAFAEAGEISSDGLFDVLDGAAKAVHLRTGKRSVSAVVSIDERAVAAWHELLVGGRDVELRLATMDLARHTGDSLRVWAQRQDVDLPAFEKAETAEEIVRATGGWPLLVDRVARELLGHRNLRKALGSLAEYLDTGGSSDLVAASGVTAAPGLERAFRFFVDIADQGLEAVDAVEMFADISSVSNSEAEAGWRVLRALDLLQVSERDGTVRPEPVVAAAFTRR